MNLVILIGPPGTFVNEAAGELSAQLKREFATTDALIALSTGSSVDQLSLEGGEEKLREFEREAALTLLSQVGADSDRILALGSGCLGSSLSDSYFDSVWARMQELGAQGCHIVWLTGDLTTLVKRTGIGGLSMASVGSPRKTFFNHLAQREPVYQKVATASVDTSGLELGGVVEQILAVID